MSEKIVNNEKFDFNEVLDNSKEFAKSLFVINKYTKKLTEKVLNKKNTKIYQEEHKKYLLSLTGLEKGAIQAEEFMIVSSQFLDRDDNIKNLQKITDSLYFIKSEILKGLDSFGLQPIGYNIVNGNRIDLYRVEDFTFHTPQISKSNKNLGMMNNNYRDIDSIEKIKKEIKLNKDNLLTSIEAVFSNSKNNFGLQNYQKEILVDLINESL